MMKLADICVIYNPHSGRGRGAVRVNKLRRVLGWRAAFWPTDAPGHGEELAHKAADAGFRIVGAAGGDGTVHEVANGLLAGKPGSVLAVLPFGSANDYAFSLDLTPDWWLRPDHSIIVRHVDVGLVQSPDGRRRHFINNLGIGFNGMVTREARRIKSLQGIPLYGLALIRAMRNSYHFPLLSIQLDDAPARQLPTLSMTVGVGRREGAFPLTRLAELDDGLFDYVHVGALRRLRLLSYVPRMISGRLPTEDPNICLGRCSRIRVQSEVPLMTHADGEFFCQPEEETRELDISLLPGRLPVLGRTGSSVQ